ncbi:hypothetical protein Tco_1113040 [Tanacetum coccineum]|uniref:Uncharacterized protein n=1 Tax=Tanacetum coccineum TaxID=301880 RepID=A0ABQ5ITE5_9ASTR
MLRRTYAAISWKEILVQRELDMISWSIEYTVNAGKLCCDDSLRSPPLVPVMSWADGPKIRLFWGQFLWSKGARKFSFE